MRLLVLLILLRPGDAAQQPVVGSGSLERVMHQAITIKRPDGVLIDARLPSTGTLWGEVLAAKYKLGDRVEIACKRIPPVWDPEAQAHRSLELERVLYLRPPSPDELAFAIASRAWREPGNLLAPPAAVPVGAGQEFSGPTGEREILERAREVILKYVAALPNFIADETATRYVAPAAPPHWRLLDTIQSDVTFQGANETRDHVFQDGKPVTEGMEAVRGLHWSGTFGAVLKPLFDPECPVHLEFEKRTAARGLQLLVYKFSSPPDSCFAATQSDAERYYAARQGEVFIDEAAGYVIQLNTVSTEFPTRFSFVEASKEISWDYVNIGDASHLLPVSADNVARHRNGGFWWISLKYTNHRHFEAASTVGFH